MKRRYLIHFMLVSMSSFLKNCNSYIRSISISDYIYISLPHILTFWLLTPELSMVLICSRSFMSCSLIKYQSASVKCDAMQQLSGIQKIIPLSNYL